MTAAKQSITELYDLIQSRKSQPVSGSYTDYLFTKGLDKILKKSRGGKHRGHCCSQKSRRCGFYTRSCRSDLSCAGTHGRTRHLP